MWYNHWCLNSKEYAQLKWWFSFQFWSFHLVNSLLWFGDVNILKTKRWNKDQTDFRNNLKDNSKSLIWRIMLLNRNYLAKLIQIDRWTPYPIVNSHISTEKESCIKSTEMRWTLITDNLTYDVILCCYPKHICQRLHGNSAFRCYIKANSKQKHNHDTVYAMQVCMHSSDLSWAVMLLQHLPDF